MAGALYWSDEIPNVLTWLAENSLRPVLRYRTSLILGASEIQWLDYWKVANRAFPKWIGFMPARCSPNKVLVEHLRRLEADSNI